MSDAPADRTIGPNDFLISRTDLEGNVTFANEAFAKSLGYEVAQIVGQPYARLVPPDMPKSAFLDVRNTISSGQRWEGISVNLGSDGSRLWSMTSVAPCWQQGRLTGFTSLRTQADEPMIDETRRMFALLNGPQSGRYGVRHGRLVRRGGVAKVRSVLAEGLTFLHTFAAPIGVLACFAVVLGVLTLSRGASGGLSGSSASPHPSGVSAVALTIGWGAFVCAVLLTGYHARIVTRDMLGPVRHIGDYLHRVASGDLSGQFERRVARAFTPLVRSLNLTRASLGLIVGNIGHGARELALATGQVAEGNADLSIRTERTAVSLQMTAAEMQELTHTVGQNAAHANEVARIATDTAQLAKEGGQRMHDAVEAIHTVSDSSRKIVEITSLIDGIAAQTNILAINAAIEAARAGEQGRGFAVVAGEVRVLSQRTAAAAREIASLVAHSVQQVERGRERVEEASTVTQSITEAVQRVDQLMVEISAASEAQSDGLKRVNSAMTRMDADLQQNAALVEQVAAAGESLKEQSAMFTSMVQIFQTA
jgi:aerotaxis receptor